MESIHYVNQCQDEQKYFFDSDDGRYKTLFEQANASVFLTTLSGRIIEANVKSYEMFSYGFGEIKNRQLSDLLSPIFNLDERIEETISQGGSTFEAIAIRSDYTQFPVEINASLFSIRNQPYFLILLRDISEQKKRERLLREQQQKYQRLFKSTTDGMIILDARGEIIDINNQALTLMGLSKEQTINNNLLTLGIFPEKAMEVLITQFEWCLNNKRPTPRQIQLRHLSGKSVYVEMCSFFLYKGNNELETFVVIFHDLSEQQQVEKELKKTQSVLHHVLEQTSDAIYYKNMNNQFTLVNLRTANLLDKTTEEMIGKTEYDFLSSDIAKTIFEEDQIILQHGQTIIDQPRQLHLPFGIVKDVLITKIPHIDENGTIIGLLAIIKHQNKSKNEIIV